MSNKQDQQGIHYHYHFYGAGAGAADTQAGQQQGTETQQGGYGPNPFPGGPFPGGAGPAEANPGANPGANLHAHPGADSFIKGLLVGAGAAWLLTNENAQRTIIRSAVQLWAAVQGGVEELKEKLHDAEAEVAATAAPQERTQEHAHEQAQPVAETVAAPPAPQPDASGAEGEGQQTARQLSDGDPSVIAPRFFQSGS